MSSVNGAIDAGSVTPPSSIKVWDPLVRMFHWSLATLFLVAYATGDDAEGLHIAAGYGIAGLTALRVAWGFVGPRQARFSDFVRSPRVILAYLRDAARLRAPRYLGHNPAGGAMIIALLIMLTGTAVTGTMMTTDAYWGATWVEELHGAAAGLTVGLVIFHILGVLISSFGHRENLIKSMITGRKQRT
jgi:cytochrome b